MLTQVIEVAQAAGKIIEEVQAGDFDVEQKGSQGPVTEADRRADAYLRENLLKLESAGWLSEETADNEDRLAQSLLWVVDPLDGTKEFVQKIPEYSVAIALVEDGQPILGVVHNPVTGDVYSAERGKGAHRNGQPITVKEGKAILASRSEMKRGEFAPFMDAWEISHMGSIEYKLARIAAGDAAVTLSRGPKWEWDVCAGAILVAEAGGQVADAFGEPFTFNQKFPKVKGILAGAPEAYGQALHEVLAMGQSDRMKELTG